MAEQIAKSLCFLSTAISEFPEDLFSIKERQQGAVLLHIFCVSHSSMSIIIRLVHRAAIRGDIFRNYEGPKQG